MRSAEDGGARLSIDLAAVQENYAILKTLAGRAEVAAVVKANAYGLGTPQIAPALLAAGCRSYFVATAAEGIALRPHLPDPAKARVFVLHGLADATLELLQAKALIPVLSTVNEVIALKKYVERGFGPLPHALHVDTGMNRLGLSPGDLEAAAGLAPVLLMSHLACADEPGPQNARQAERFAQARARFPGVPASLANSAGILLGAAYHHDLVRPGIALYGGNPTPGPNPFRTVVTLEAPILQIRAAPAGDTVGYGATHLLTAPARIATLGIGYADGYLRQLSNKAEVAIAGYRAPVIGRVSMDLVTVDVTRIPEHSVRPGMMAELFGATIALEEVAAKASTVNYEVLTRLGQRLARRYFPPAEAAAR